ncbi:hypothetical protein BN946_scf184354.g3 [Trametes cinnabarina]|uniref:Protein kinase domain-containing protein n=1 Tax=Pycnoporus cinnabarinus TaxID=5643 RepID=A0A060S705_PYCCI|nr:hypothetical protein BN946_scf184354.g3 [Trametes cinnabarina]
MSRGALLCYRSSATRLTQTWYNYLQALAFIHTLGIAHRDTEKSHFLVQYHPESLITMGVPLTRPRVYLNDFEYAIDFVDPAATTDLGPAEGYLRQLAPEVYLGKQYDPFKADVWQFGYSFSNFVSTIPAIDEILDNIISPDAAVRPTAAEARDQLALVVHSMLPTALLICPVVFERGQWQTVEAWAKSIYGS